MNKLVDEFLKSLETRPKEDTSLQTAIKLLEVCREYIHQHWVKSVYGSKQKALWEVIDEFIEDCNDQNKPT